MLIYGLEYKFKIKAPKILKMREKVEILALKIKAPHTIMPFFFEILQDSEYKVRTSYFIRFRI
jgi:hypothetical protein